MGSAGFDSDNFPLYYVFLEVKQRGIPPTDHSLPFPMLSQKEGATHISSKQIICLLQETITECQHTRLHTNTPALERR